MNNFSSDCPTLRCKLLSKFGCINVTIGRYHTQKQSIHLYAVTTKATGIETNQTTVGNDECKLLKGYELVNILFMVTLS